MYLGRIVEIGPSEAIYEDPKHPYTQALLRAIPEPDPLRAVPRDLPRGEVPDAARPPRGCSFHPRCPRAFEICGWETRDLRDLLEAHWARAGAEQYEAERPLFGDLDSLRGRRTGSPSACRRAQARPAATCSRSSSGCARTIPTSRSGRACGSMHAGADALEIEWNEPREPRLVPSGPVEVECHLYG